LTLEFEWAELATSHPAVGTATLPHNDYPLLGELLKSRLGEDGQNSTHPQAPAFRRGVLDHKRCINRELFFSQQEPVVFVS
ncbi:MAG TPA: hypothetical protein VED37_16890, partial [Ktedonobacteraceae bacterium]|nr:hypothetical protein [Ktedonobacteraceae bacterium]